ncbi:MAG: archaemetzincin family Zn-dependent metalloprotease [candidate division Zixibacteria bacterium]|nr:archaemetzincin family Zn-dependent metalloprotease [candidate division Zixibacteria bacterium]
MKSRGKIIIVPLGDLDFYQINKLAANLSVAFSSGVDILQGVELPDEADNEQRGQFYSTIILTKLELMRQNETEKVLGVTEEDLYIPTTPYVYGEADPQSGCAVMSFFRLRQEFFGMAEDDKQIYSRALKEAIHLVGQLHRLVSCTNPRCVMYHSSTMRDTDTKADRFCDNCQRRLVRHGV